MSKVLIVFRTRPELIKLAPVIFEFKKRNLQKKVTVLNTGQHKDLLGKYFEIIDTHPYDRKIMNRKLEETILKTSQLVKVVA
jgi:UDP-N-acetylglucosamine 2-epimerase